MNNTLSYRDYTGSVEYSSVDNCLFGRVLGINDMVSYEGASVEELRQAFEEAVDDYLTLCAETGKEPEREYKGSFNVRISPELHRKAAIRAVAEGKTLNNLVVEALQHYV